MRTLITLILCFVATFTIAQNQDPRIELTKPVEAKIKTYIAEHLKGYKVTKAELDELTKDDGHGHENELKNFTKAEKEQIILSNKKWQLRAQFFNENPHYRELYIAKSNSRGLLQDNCENPTFDDGVTGYNFFSAASWGAAGDHPGKDQVNLGAQVGDNLPSNLDDPFSSFPIQFPVPLDDNDTYVSLVSQGDDPTLARGGVTLHRTHSGNRALRLNFVNGGTEDATILTKDYIINERYLSLWFALVFHNPSHPEGDNPFVRFEVFDHDLNRLVDSRYISSIDSGDNFEEVTLPNERDPHRYLDWACLDFDLSESIGHNVTLRILSSDCSASIHEGILYLDDICNSGNKCNDDDKVLGDLNLNPLQLNCPENSFQVCGSYTPPTGTVGDPSLVLEITGISTPFTNYTVDSVNKTFCFTLNPSNFGSNPSGNYPVKVTGTFNINDGGQITVVDDTGVNITFNDCGECDIEELDPRFDIINGLGYILWNDLASSYTIQIVSDADCFSIGNDTGPVVFKEYNINSPASSFNIHQAFADMDRSEVRWKFKSNCSEWSDWCCAILYGGNDPNDLLLQSDCYETVPCPNGPITLTSPTHDIASGETNYIDHTTISASNKIGAAGKSENRAGESITLTPGFEVAPGGDYWGHILECIDYNNPTNFLDTPEDVMQNVLTVFPNPAEHTLTLEVGQDKLNSLQLYNTQGQVMYSDTNIDAKNFNLNVESFSRGFYILKVVLSNQSVIYKNVVLK